MIKITAKWTAFPGAPGFSNFYFDEASDPVTVQDIATDVAQFISGVAGYTPNGTTIRIDPNAEIIDPATGTITGLVPLTAPPAAYVSQAQGTYSGPSGAVIDWLTNTVRSGSKVRGKTFIVPLVASAYDGTGTLNDAVVVAYNSAASALVNAGDGLVVWGRPSAKLGAGIMAPVVGSRTPDMAAVLRSRRS